VLWLRDFNRRNDIGRVVLRLRKNGHPEKKVQRYGSHRGKRKDKKVRGLPVRKRKRQPASAMNGDRAKAPRQSSKERKRRPRGLRKEQSSKGPTNIWEPRGDCHREGQLKPDRQKEYRNSHYSDAEPQDREREKTAAKKFSNRKGKKNPWGGEMGSKTEGPFWRLRADEKVRARVMIANS